MGQSSQSPERIRTIVAVPFNNRGTLQVLTNTLSLNLGGTHTGTFSNAPSAALNLGGGSHVLAAGSLIAAGSAVNLSGAATLTASDVFGVGSALNLNSAIATPTATCDMTAATLGINGANCVVNYKSRLVLGTSAFTTSGLQSGETWVR